MKKLMKILVLGSTILSAMPAFAENDGQQDTWTTRGPGGMSCKDAMRTLRDDPRNVFLSYYLDGFVNAMNTMAAANNHLPQSGDIADHEKVADMARMVITTCRIHPKNNFDDTVVNIVARISQHAEE